MEACLFCKIVGDEIPATKIYENDVTLAFLDIHPVNAGHTLVVPKKHAQNIFDVSPQAWSAVMETVRLVAPTIEKSLNANGLNLEMNNREYAGQIIDHVHVHIIPRFTGDGLKHWPQRLYKEGEAEETAGKIRAALE